MKTRLLPILVLCACFVLTSCTGRHVYQKYIKIPDYIWDYREPVSFNFYISDNKAVYNTYLNLRIASIYPYSNIWISLKKNGENGKIIYTKRFEFTLADEKGEWTGKGLGDIIDNQFIIEKQIQFEESGEYTYTFSHDMRIDFLPAVMDIGLVVEKIKVD